MNNAKIKSVSFNADHREIMIIVSAKDSVYVEEPKGMGFPQLRNSGPLIEGINHILEFHFHAVNALKANPEYQKLIEENRNLRKRIQESDLAIRARQLLSSLEYEKLTDFQAKCVLLLEKELYKS
jgi:hypothetical protein